MKSFLVLFLILSTQAFAGAREICKFEETVDFIIAVEHGQGKEVSVSRDHFNFTKLEKQMIFQAVSNEQWRGVTSVEEALNAFGDFRDGSDEPGSDAGSIIYYQAFGTYLALVSYYPGENEYGAIFELKKSGKFEMIAKVGDSFIECLK